MMFTSVFNSNSRDHTNKPKHGKVFNSHDGRFYDVNQIKKLVTTNRNLPGYPGFPNRPTDLQLERDSQCRKEFTKPYNILVMNDLNVQWIKAVEDGEINPGKEHLKRIDDPGFYNVWG